MPWNELCGCAEFGCANKWNEQVLENEENEDDDEGNKSNDDKETDFDLVEDEDDSWWMHWNVWSHFTFIPLCFF